MRARAERTDGGGVIRNLLAGLLLAAIYGVALRLYLAVRLGRPAERWHWPAVAYAALLGGAAMYAAQKIRAPRAPEWLDVPAFLIMAVAAAAIPAILEVSSVATARRRRRGSITVPPGDAPR